MSSFSDFDLIHSLQRTLKSQKLFTPTEIQARVIPKALAKQAVVGISETGSGKTLAYVLPILHELKALEDQQDPVTNDRGPRAIVLAPTRELGEQIARVFKTFTHETRLRVRTALGGTKLEQARRNAADKFEVLLATPGRLTQMIEKDLVDLSDVRVFVLDEADQLVDEGFLGATKAIVAACPEGVRMSLFSATISKGVRDLIDDLFPGVEVVESRGSGKVAPTLETKNLVVEDGKRWPILEKLLKKSVEGGTMLFTNTREQCDRLAKLLTEAGFANVIYRGEMDKGERRSNLKAFRDGRVPLLVSTDLGGRGLDVESVGRVINYHLPQDKQNYLHRAGRTARAGRAGLVVNLVTERDAPLMNALSGKRPRTVAAKGKAPLREGPARSSKPGLKRRS